MAHTISYEYRSSPANLQLSTKKLGKLRKWHKTGPIGDHPIIYLGNGKHPVPLKINEEYPLSNEIFVPSYPQVEWECDHLVWDRGACQSLSQLETGTLDLEVKLIRWKFIKFVQSTVTQKKVKQNEHEKSRTCLLCYAASGRLHVYLATMIPFSGALKSILSATEQLLFCLGDAATSGALYNFLWVLLLIWLKINHDFQRVL